MELEAGLARITAPTLIVTTPESGLQSVEAVERYAKNFPDARVLVLAGRFTITSLRSSPICARGTRWNSSIRPRDATPQPPQVRRSDKCLWHRLTPGGIMTVRPTRRAVLAGIAAAPLLPQASRSEASYPNRPVRIVVPFAPGGGADIVSRLLQTHLQQALGQPFVVENRAGAAGRIGTALVAKADPDGHTLLTTTESSMVIAPHTGVVLGYDPLKDFAPVSLLTRNTVVLVVHPSVPAKTLKDYMALANAQPGKLFYGSSGVGGPNHLAGEIFNRMTGLNIVHVPFPGTGAAIPAVIGNQVGAMWGFTAGLIPFIRDGAAPGARGQQQRALAGAAGRADRGRGGRAGLRGDVLDRTCWRPPATPPADHRPAVGRGEHGDESPVGARDADQRRHRHRREQARRIPRGDRQRSGEIRQARGPVQGPEMNLGIAA